MDNISEKTLSSLSQFIPDTMRCDQYHFQQRLKKIKNQLKKGQPPKDTTLDQLTADIERSLKQRQHRLNHLPTPAFPEDLPIYEHIQEISQAVENHQVIIIAGETGSGKTTQIPKICLSLQRGVMGLIGCTQPRRIAAKSIAERVADELESPLGHAVGYKVRFSDHLSADTYIKFMTDGILLAETQSDRFLEQYDTLIIDEAHERSLNIDFLLGYLKNLMYKQPDLKLIITSATIDTQRFSAHFNQAPIINIAGRAYPVEVRYRPLLSEDEDEQDRDMQQAIVEAVDEIDMHDPRADILVFLSGERDIRDTAESLRKHKLKNTEVLPLYARLSSAEQNRVFQPGHQRRIILATNVAETSLTVPRIKAVIDTGLARISRYSIRNKIQRLPIEKISRSSADQRKGRCGRIAPGVCIRLYDEQDYLTRPAFTDPEILRTSLAAVILQMLSLKLGEVAQFPFIEPPTHKMINDGFNLLIELGAVDSQRQLTTVGQQLAKMPIDPRLARMILAAKTENCLQEILIIVSVLSIQDPRQRPLDAQEAADKAQSQFLDEQSDFLSFIKLWYFYQDKAKHLSKAKLRQLCHDYFLSYLRMREWHDIHHQLTTLVKEWGWHVNQLVDLFNLEKKDFLPIYDAIHRALLSGLLGNIATKSHEEHYLGTRNLKFYIFPGSGLFKKPPKWLMSAELLETTKLFARCNAKISPEWVEAIAKHLCQYHYFEPHWEKKPAQVAAYQKVTLYGLTLVPKRKVNFGPLDPDLSREIFIRSALVEGDYQTRAAFFKHNQDLIAEIATLEHKSRRQDILVDDQQLFEFYDQRIPVEIYSGHAFEKWRKQAEKQNPQLLFLTREILMHHTGSLITGLSFPDYLWINNIKLPLSYHFDPGHACDGVTVTIPLTLLNQLPSEPFEWLVPGLLEEKIIALIRSLPKNIRRAFVPIPDMAQVAFSQLIQQQTIHEENGVSFEGSLYEKLIHFLHRQRGAPLPANPFDLDSLSPYLFMNFRLEETAQKVLAHSRDLNALKQQWGTRASETSQQQVAKTSGLERENIKVWNFGELPAQVNLVINGMTVQGFPTLVDKTTHVDLRVLDHPAEAQQTLRAGLRRLFLLNLPTKRLLKQVPINNKLCLQYMRLGSGDELREDVFLATVDTLFLAEPLPRDQAAFEQRINSGHRQWGTVVNEYVNYLTKTLEVYNQVVQKLVNWQRSSSQTLQEIQAHLDSLIYKGFVQQTPLEQMTHLPRYLTAIRIRMEKLENAPAKDDPKAAQLRPLWQQYWQLRQDTAAPSADLLAFRWMLEEFRVSLFAQELKTAYPISLKRLESALKQLHSLQDS